MHYHRIASQFYNRPLWLMPSAAETISAFLLGRMRAGGGGESDSGAATQAFAPTAKADGSVVAHSPRASRFHGEYRIGADGQPKPYRETPDGTAIITVIGELANRGAYVGASSGIVTYEGVSYQLRQAAKDPGVKRILIDMESPGGEATGAFEAAAVVRQVAAAKPVHAVVNGLAASAGYALISGATRITTMPSGVSGSIGVVLLHLDFSAQLDMLGVKPTMIHAGAHKVDGNPFEPLPDDVRARLQAEIAGYYDQFVETVAAGRRRLMPPTAIRGTEARTYIGQAAVDVGLADAVGTLEDVLEELAGRRAESPTIRRPTATRSALAAASALATPKQSDPIAAIKVKVAAMRKAYAHAPPFPLPTPHQPQQETPPVSNTQSTPAGWRAEYIASPALQAEFISAESYVAYRQAAANGLVRIHAPGLHAPATNAPAKPGKVQPVAADDATLRRLFDAPTADGAALRAEFQSFGAFSAYYRAAQRGAVHHHRGAGVSR